MPIYPFRCENCGSEEEFITTMSNAPKSADCNICGNEMYRVYSFNVGNKEYAKPLVSDSLAMNPNQIAEHNKLFPDIEVHSDGRPQFNNFKQHDDYLEKVGFVKKPKKIKPKGKILPKK